MAPFNVDDISSVDKHSITAILQSIDISLCEQHAHIDDPQAKVRATSAYTTRKKLKAALIDLLDRLDRHNKPAMMHDKHGKEINHDIVSFLALFVDIAALLEVEADLGDKMMLLSSYGSEVVPGNT